MGSRYSCSNSNRNWCKLEWSGSNTSKMIKTNASKKEKDKKINNIYIYVRPRLFKWRWAWIRIQMAAIWKQLLIALFFLNQQSWVHKYLKRGKNDYIYHLLQASKSITGISGHQGIISTYNDGNKFAWKDSSLFQVEMLSLC